jgi:uncharacterized protein YjbI with pentapeptide repeats
MIDLDLLKNNDSNAFNAWHKANCANPISFKGQHLQNTFLTDFNLVNVDFSDSIIEECYFKRVQFWASDFTNVQFKRCHFISCHFGTPEFIDASSYLIDFMFKSPIFFNTYFFKGNMLNTNFREISLENSHFDECIFEKCDLRKTILSDTKDTNSDWLNNLK